ncbi:MAG: AAA family ATPase [Gammaproteobacteria bacterium]
MIDFIKETFHRLIEAVNTQTYRYLYTKLNLNNRLTGIIGARGVGKTTMMLQYIKNHLYQEGKTFYFSADNIYFSKATILEFIAELHRTEDICYFFIDEIHKYKNWNQELKNIYDSFPKIKVVFSGSSSIDLIKGSYDLSRRTKIHKLTGLSLREYINFKYEKNISVIEFDDLITNYKKYDATLPHIPKIKGIFHEYLQNGYYPFVFEDQHSYYEKLAQIIDKTIFEDIANYYNLKTINLTFFKKILNFLATALPGKISVHNLASSAGINDKTISNYLNILNEIGLIRFIFPYGSGSKLLRKPEKIFLDNTTLLHALNNYLDKQVSKGSERELFFLQATSNLKSNTFHSNMGDFQIADVIFEIGGKNKKKNQIKNTKLPAILVKDDIFVSGQNEIPLFYFGFLY